MLTPAQIDAIQSHLAKLDLRCPFCHGEGWSNWVLHGELVGFPQFTADLKPLPSTFVAALIKCKRCRFVAPFRAVGDDHAVDVSGGESVP